MDDDGIMARQKVYKWHSAVTGATLSSKMTRAMHPEPPEKITDTVTRLEEWSALAEHLEKY
eukprot:1844390-Pyramimonas_sp.AAC.1